MRSLAVVLVLASCSSPPPSPPPAPAAAPVAAPVVIARARRAPPVREPIAAWSLTASDGSGLELEAVDAKAVIEGPLAFTELHLRFRNPEDRIREGTFAITLPARAAVSRFAMAEEGHYKEAEVVPKALARRAYDDALHRGIDPAILEKGAGNQFTARVFPIPARDAKELVISYSQELAATGYVLPLTGLPKIADVAVSLETIDARGGHHTQVLHEHAWQPDHDFVADVAMPVAIATGTLVAGTFDVALGGAAALDPPTSLAVLVDTSASRAPGFPRYVDRVRGLIAALGTVDVEIVAFDQETHAVYAGPARGFGDAEVAALLERRAAGASDLGQASASVHAPRVAIITDGVISAGLEGTALAKTFHAAERVDVILAGGIRDEHLATLLARAGARPGDVFDLDDAIEPIATGLGQAVRIDVPIEVPGATWFQPHVLAAWRPGTQVTVFARLALPESAFAVAIGDSHVSAAVGPATPAFLERAAARVEIEELEVRLAKAPDAKLAKQIEALSIAARVASSQATLLVLDSDADYARYGIDRNALADILVVGPHGLEQTHRTFVASKDAPRGHTHSLLARAEQRGGTGSGYGSGSGRGGLRSRVASVPTISIGQPNVTGSLDKTFIRRYLHRHLEKITYCYEHELLGHPRLHGTVQTQFAIAPDGTVHDATASGVSEQVAACIAEVLTQIAFPSGSDATIIVNYPFTFRIAGTAPDDAPQVAAAPIAPPAVTPAPPSDASFVPAQAPPATDAAATPHVAATPAPDPSVAPVVPATPAVPDGPVFGSPASALDGKLARIMRTIGAHDAPLALALALAWRDEAPTDILALVGLGEAFEATHDLAAAARAYGSIIDLYPSRADYRRFAGERLERLGAPARALAIDTYRRAVADRPDQVTGHRLLAYALLRSNDFAGAFAAILAGVDQHTAADRFAGAPLVFARDAGMIATAYLAHGGNRERIEQALAKRELGAITEASTRFLLYWETDANDVDLHVHDAHGGHAWYSHKQLESGGELYADVTTGFGPECFEIKGAPTAGPYTLGVHYYAQGPMGYGMGLLQVVRFDGHAFAFEDRPYVIMKNQAYVALGKTR